MSAKTEIPIGERFGELVVTGRAPNVVGTGGAFVFAKCDCGTERRYRLRALTRGGVSRCGTKQHRDRDMIAKGESMVGERFGKLLVVASTAVRADDSRGAQVLVRCDCGAERYARITDLRGGGLRSCNGEAHRDLKPQAKRWEVHGKKGTYALEALGTGMVKIGMARDLRNRVYKMQCQCPVELRVIAWCDDDIERRLHIELDAHRAHGEWFHANETVMSAIAAQLQPASMSLIADIKRAGRRDSTARCKQCGGVGHYAKTCSAQRAG